jgi:hypothetical protein
MKVHAVKLAKVWRLILILSYRIGAERPQVRGPLGSEPSTKLERHLPAKSCLVRYAR